ncbi:phage major capsid protein [Clostridium botulinum]|uniref:phage major capsid protein n=1 Tax=Clostridium botulinum TaxID=1491 RepID=UPI000174E4C1|nr:phage major capsid protein [Clostridium botulinum]ACD53742.1 phage capsid family [Clostridium botulinum E3 str. Alaska E43]MCR1159366.1 phage major capsid protein [Clostridium botulinum]NFG46914.1 phage major capsid protein [Clostridium botulinum]NFQ94725.1 phage major capsid protein [Clostridium botulinum]
MADTGFLKDNLTGTIPVEIAKEVIKNVIDQASILKVCKRENMESDTRTLPQLTDSGSASWVKEGEMIGTAIPKFAYPQLKACKLAVIVPVTVEKNDDSVINVMEEIKQAMADAFAKAIDQAMIFGIESPFNTNLISAVGTQKVTATDRLDTDLSNAMGLVEDNKYNCNNILMGTSQKKVLRALSNDSKYKGAITLTDAYDTPIEFVRNFDDKKSLAITGDFSKAIIGTRESIDYKVLDQATIKSGDTEINLAQQDMIAIKATMRLGFVVVDPKAFSMVVSA